MPHDFLPASESALNVWLDNVKSLIAASPATYGLTSANASEISTAYANWYAAYLVAVAPMTRTTGAVSTKNAQKAIVVGIVRRYATVIRGNTAVSNALKLDLGLRLRVPGGSPVPKPDTQPQIELMFMDTARQKVRVTSVGTNSRRARPANTTGALLFRVIGDEPALYPTGAEFLAMVTKGTYLSEFDHTANGKIATYFARWTNAKGEVGPWSSGLSVGIAA
jgi:hypothetical protein